MRGFEKGKKVALVISECQRGVIDAELSGFPSLVEQVNKRGIVSKIARLAEHFRSAGQPVIHAHVVHNKNYEGMPMTNLIVAKTAKMGGMQIGSPDVDPVPELEPKDTDIVHARAFSLVAFNGTDFDSTLRHRGIETLVLAGVSSNIAIPGMSVCASDLGYQVVIAEDCIAGATEQTHDFMVKNMLPLYASLSNADTIRQALSEC